MHHTYARPETLLAGVGNNDLIHELGRLMFLCMFNLDRGNIS